MKEQPDSKKLPASLENSQVVFKGSRFDVRRIGNRDAVIHPGAVVILPLIDKDHIVLIRNERFAVGETLWELPAGTLEPKEQPIETAKRELIEETGYQTNNIQLLLSFYTSPGICNEHIYAYLAKDLQFVGQKLEETEKITVEILSQQEVIKMIHNGDIHDGKTLATLLYYFFNRLSNVSHHEL